MENSRLRDLGYPTGVYPCGEYNAITDVPGVRVGHATIIQGEGQLRRGEGPVRTGVTVLLPHGGNLFQHKLPAAVYTINGFGKVVGFEQIRELGTLESPIALTNTLNVGLVMDALVQYAIEENPAIGIQAGTVNVVVGETNDGYLNDIQGRHVRTRHVLQAIEAAASGPVAEGCVGAGTGTVCLGWKGGIGTSSRVLPGSSGGFRVGALVQTNFGLAKDLTILGVPVGRLLQPGSPKGEEPGEESGGPGARVDDQGSVMILLATDAPLDSRQLKRLCVRAAAGLARTGGSFAHGSGDFVIAFSTARRIHYSPEVLVEHQPVLAAEGKVMPALFAAVVECVEEAILNSLTGAYTMTGRDGHTAYRLPVEEVVRLLERSDPGKAGV